MKFENCKVHVPTPAISEKVQNKLISIGYRLCETNSYYVDSPYLFLHKSGEISHGVSRDILNHMKMIPYQEILSGKVPELKKPTHVVVWEEETDPAKFFTSKKEAEDFIKTLIDKPEVCKDSIVLVEIKSAKKVMIKKSLNKKNYKI